MIALLRLASLAANLLVLAGVPLLLGAGWPWALACATLGFGLCWWTCGRMPEAEEGPPEVREAAARAAARLRAPAPRFVVVLPGWTAAAVRRGLGYGLALGGEVDPAHAESLLVHEVAHHVAGDLLWEPFTDGFARLLMPLLGRVPPLGVVLFPFFLFGAPLARLTELRADQLAARAYPPYPAVMKEVAPRMERFPSLLYPPLRERIAAAARFSKIGGRAE